MNIAENTEAQPIRHSTDAYYVGSSIIGIKYDKGILLASDTRINYGHFLWATKNEERIQMLTPRTLFAYSGEHSDMQETVRILKELITQDALDSNYNNFLGPKELANYLSLAHYQRRNKLDPYLNNVIAGGVDFNGELVLMNIDPFGTFLTGDFFTTSMGRHFCTPILRNYYPDDHKKINFDQALEILKKCFGVLFCRHLQAGDVVKYMALEKEDEMGGNILRKDGKFKVEVNWNFKGFRATNEDNYMN